MTKESGLGDNFYIGGYNISGDVGSIKNLACPMAVLPVTGIDKLAYERIGGRHDGAMSFVTWFNPAAAPAAHGVLKGLPTADVVCTYNHGSTLGNVAAAMVGKQLNYDPSRGEDGSLTFGVDVVANGYGLDWGQQLTAGIRTDTAATNGSSIDTVSSQTFGLQAYLQVFSVTGTSVTVSIEDSANNIAFATVSGATFAAVNGAAVSGQRIAVTGTVRQYLRVVTTGTFSNAQFAVMANKNFTAVSF